MFEITFLGTSASAPSPKRNLPAYLVQHDEFRFLVDCGEGTQRQILQSGLGFKRLNRILITHGHLDHILGLGGLLSTFMRWETIDNLEIYGGAGALERIRDLVYGVVLRGAQAPMPISLITVKPGVIFDSGDLTVTAFPVNHRGPDNYGYLFEEKGRRPFLAEKADALGIPPGPLRGKLVSGASITLEDGREITPEMVMGEFRSGTRLAALGDLGETDSLADLLQGVDGLVMRIHLPGGRERHGEAVLAPHRQASRRVRETDRRGQADAHPPQPPLPRQGRARRSPGSIREHQCCQRLRHLYD